MHGTPVALLTLTGAHFCNACGYVLLCCSMHVVDIRLSCFHLVINAHAHRPSAVAVPVMRVCHTIMGLGTIASARHRVALSVFLGFYCSMSELAVESGRRGSVCCHVVCLPAYGLSATALLFSIR